MRIARIKIAMFALFLATPVLALAGFGVVDSYGGDDHPEFPSVEQILGKRGRPDQFGRAVMHRSAATKLAIELRGWIGYGLVGFVDARRVVSGEEGWLFYRPEFSAGRCLDEGKVAASLRGLAALIGMAQAAGIDMIVPVAPDKSTVYPEHLSRLARGYWRCHEQDVALLRRLAKQYVPRLLYHADAILAEKARQPDVPLYYAADTHWTQLGASAALRDLVETVFPGAVIPPPYLSGETTLRSTDMFTMLLISDLEPMAFVDPAWWESLRAANRDPADLHTVIVRDSFYGVIEAPLKAIFPGSLVINYTAGDEKLDAGVMSADRLIVASVERSLLARIEDGELEWGAAIPNAILKRNQARAQSCGALVPMTAAGDARDVAVEVPAVAPSRLPCLRMSLDASGPGVVEISLPDDTGAFAPGQVVRAKIAPGDQAVTLVLPDHVAGAGIRIALQVEDGAASLKSIAFGAIDRAPLTSSSP